MIAFDLDREGLSQKIEEFQSTLQESVHAKLRVVVTAEPGDIPNTFEEADIRAILINEAVEIDPDTATAEINPRLEALIVNVQKAEQGSDLSKMVEADMRKYQFTLQQILQDFPQESRESLTKMILTQHFGIKEWQITDAEKFHPTEFGQARALVFRTEFHPNENSQARKFLLPQEMINYVQGALEGIQGLQSGIDALHVVNQRFDQGSNKQDLMSNLTIEVNSNNEFVIHVGEVVSLPKHIARAWVQSQI